MVALSYASCIARSAAPANLVAAANGRQTAFYRLSDVARRKPRRIRDNLDSLVSGLQSGKLRPLIAELVPLDRVADAHRLIEHGNVLGKILLVP
jgi:NADPH:quinone reductase-like Zn-dependent oxidoreductase